MSEKKVCELTIMDITERMLNFTLREDVLEAENVAAYNNGSRDALREMREDMERMTEREFFSKYEEISLEKDDERFDLEQNDPKAQYLDGYCNTVEDVLSFLDPAFIYKQMDSLMDDIESENVDDILGEDHHHHDCDCGCGHCH